MVTCHNGDLILVSPELTNIFLDPFEYQFLVEETKVITRGGKVPSNREAKDVSAVVKADNNDVLILGEEHSIVCRQSTRAEFERP